MLAERWLPLHLLSVATAGQAGRDPPRVGSDFGCMLGRGHAEQARQSERRARLGCGVVIEGPQPSATPTGSGTAFQEAQGYDT